MGDRENKRERETEQERKRDSKRVCEQMDELMNPRMMPDKTIIPADITSSKVYSLSTTKPFQKIKEPDRHNSEK